MPAQPSILGCSSVKILWRGGSKGVAWLVCFGYSCACEPRIKKRTQALLALEAHAHITHIALAQLHSSIAGTVRMHMHITHIALAHYRIMSLVHFDMSGSPVCIWQRSVPCSVTQNHRLKAQAGWRISLLNTSSPCLPCGKSPNVQYTTRDLCDCSSTPAVHCQSAQQAKKEEDFTYWFLEILVLINSHARTTI